MGGVGGTRSAFGFGFGFEGDTARIIRAMNMASVSASWGQICKVPSVGSPERRVGKRVELELGAIGEEAPEHALGLGDGEGANPSRTKVPPGLTPGGTRSEDLPLGCGEAMHGVGLSGPAGIGVAPPGADRRAGGVDQGTPLRTCPPCRQRACRPRPWSSSSGTGYAWLDAPLP